MQLPPLQARMVTICIMLATVMQTLDMTIANVALPHMQGALNATQEQAAWIITSYIVASAIATAPTGYLASRFGRKKLFVISIVGFTLASALCGVATNLAEMVLFRLLQGIFGAALVPVSQAILLDAHPHEKHGQAMALWGMGVMVGPILGPSLGGWLTEYISWRWVFFINVPVGVVTLLGVFAFLPESERDRSRRFDVFGFVMLSLAVGSLQLMLDRGQTKLWLESPEIIGELLLAVMCGYLFIVHLLTAKQPFLDPHAFRDRNYSASLVVIFSVGVFLLANMALVPTFLQSLLGYPVVDAGMLLAPRGMGTMVAMMVVGKLSNRVDERLLVLIGLMLTAYSLYEMSLFTLDVAAADIVRTGVIQGFGIGFVFIPSSLLAYATLAPNFRNEAAAVFGLVRNIGSSIGISMMIALLARNYQVNHEELGSALFPAGNSALILQELSTRLGGMDNGALLTVINAEVNRQSLMISYINDFRLMMYMTLGTMPLVLLLKRRQKAQTQQLAVAAAAD
ncbi:MAG: DHA2 family efflux MFS transporter permease subunit [Gammaproteobacteria bacterium]|nr:DHA2 family efflux MFS transporter permease subunit [Gammaproteobacteria bacterium]